MTRDGQLPEQFPRLDYWAILMLKFDAVKPSKDDIDFACREVRIQTTKDGSLTAQIAREVEISRQVLLREDIMWPTLLNYKFQYFSPYCLSVRFLTGIHKLVDLLTLQSNRKSFETYTTLDVTTLFAREELSRLEKVNGELCPAYPQSPRRTGPEIRIYDFDHNYPFSKLYEPSAPASICIGSLQNNGRLVFAYVDPSNRLMCAISELDEWLLPCYRAYPPDEKMCVTIFPPFTTRDDRLIKKYIMALTEFNSPSPTSDSSREALARCHDSHEEDSTPGSSYSVSTKFTFFTTT